MGESYLAGSEFKSLTTKEEYLAKILHTLVGQRVRLLLKNDEITVLVDLTVFVKEVLKRENRIETGHLTLDDVYFELVNDSGTKVFMPLVQFRSLEQYGSNRLLHFDTYWWSVQLM